LRFTATNNQLKAQLRDSEAKEQALDLKIQQEAEERDQQGNYVVADVNKDRIQIFNSQGQFMRKFGSIGSENGQIKNLLGIGLLSNGNIVVAENMGHLLPIFDPLGKFVRVVGAGQVKNPWHLFVDSDDNILVADAGNNRIQVFHQNGNHIKSIGTGQMSYPRGICMDREGRSIVSQAAAHKISIF